MCNISIDLGMIIKNIKLFFISEKMKKCTNLFIYVYYVYHFIDDIAITEYRHLKKHWEEPGKEMVLIQHSKVQCRPYTMYILYIILY